MKSCPRYAFLMVPSHTITGVGVMIGDAEQAGAAAWGLFLVGVVIGFLAGTTQTEQIYLKSIDAIGGIAAAAIGGTSRSPAILFFGAGLVFGLIIGWFGHNAYKLSVLPF
jgi:hypothetical protein